MVREKTTRLDNFEIRISNNPLSNEDKLHNIRSMSSSPKITKVFHAIFYNARNSYFLREVAVLFFGGFRFVICKEQHSGFRITLML